MRNEKGNCLVVIENGKLTTYLLDNKISWAVGRSSKENMPDINLHSLTVSRQHGFLRNIDGIWFYVDGMGKNGTVYNGKHIKPGLRGNVKPITMNHGDILIFGGGEEPIINSKTIWAMFLERTFDENWRVEDTKGYISLSFTCGNQTTVYEKPAKGMVIEKENGIAIYMGNITYLIGDMEVKGDKKETS